VDNLEMLVEEGRREKKYYEKWGRRNDSAGNFSLGPGF
jgi:hypothetical protein